MKRVFIVLWSFCALFPSVGGASDDAELIEISCLSCGYLRRFVQGSTDRDKANNVQQIIVVCERKGDIRSVKAPLDPGRPVSGEPLLAKPNGTGVSKILGIELPKFILPGNTCPLFPVTAYLDANVCPVDGQPGVQVGLVEAAQ